MRPLLQRLTSRKLWAFAVVVATAVVKARYPDFPDGALEIVQKIALGYMGVEGLLDLAAIVTKWLAERRSGGGKENKLAA